jgi:hypothetical protein
MIRVGDKIVVYSGTTFVPLNEPAELNLTFDTDDTITLQISFEECEDEIDKSKPTFSIVGSGSKGCITFKNWTSTFGLSITNPVFFATANDGERISLVGSAVKLGEIYKTELQIMKGGTPSV